MIKKLCGLLALLGAGFAGYLALIRPHVIRWGTTDEELARHWPGDDHTPHARFVSTHAITIHAPPSAIWPWIVQIGNGRAGWYSFRFVERLVKDGQLLDEGASWRILPEFQNLQVDDYIPVGDEAFRVVDIQPEQYMALEISPTPAPHGHVDPLNPGGNFNAGFNFILDPIDDRTTRLVARMRVAPRSLRETLYVVGFLEPGHAIMQTKMLHGIKARAERFDAGFSNRP